MARLSAAVLLLLFLLNPVYAGQTLEGLVAAHRAQPASRAASQALEAAVSAGLPPQINTGWLADLPVDSSPLPYGLGTLVVPKAYLPTAAVEPQHGWKFAKVSYLYLPRLRVGSSVLRRALSLGI